MGVDPNDPLDPNRDVPQSDDDTLIGGGGNDQLFGGAGRDTVDYSGDAAAGGAGGITLTLDNNGNGTATDGFGNTDTLRSIENITGTAADDRFNLQGPSGRTIDGGGGDDQVDYSAGFVWDVAGGRAWDYLGLASDTLLNVEKTTSASVVLPDLNRSGGVNYHFETVDSRNTIVFDSRYVDYSHALTSATFNLGYPEPVVINNVIQSVALLTDYDQVGLGGFTHLYGTNHGDTVHIAASLFSYDNQIAFHTGNGNDTVWLAA